MVKAPTPPETETKTQDRRRLYIAVVAGIAVVVFACLSTFRGCGRADEAAKTAKSSKSVTNEESTPKASGDWESVALNGGTYLFGRVSSEGVPEGFLALQDTYFIVGTGSAPTSTNQLRRFGSELHKPTAAVILPRSSVAFREPLQKDSPVLKAIASYEKKSKSIVVKGDLLDGERVHAVFLRDGQVFFGRVGVRGEDLVLSEAHYLKFKDSRAARSDQIESLDDIVLVPQAKTVVKPTGEMFIPVGSIEYIQVLAEDSPLVNAMAEAE